VAFSRMPTPRSVNFLFFYEVDHELRKRTKTRHRSGRKHIEDHLLRGAAFMRVEPDHFAPTSATISRCRFCPGATWIADDGTVFAPLRGVFNGAMVKGVRRSLRRRRRHRSSSVSSSRWLGYRACGVLVGSTRGQSFGPREMNDHRGHAKLRHSAASAASVRCPSD